MQFVIYDGSNGQEIFDAMNLPAGSITSDDGTTLVIADGGGTDYTYGVGDGWEVNTRGYWAFNDGGATMSERFLTVVDGRVILAP